jgi:hypothetical protein
MISKCLLAIATVANAFMPKSHAFITHAPMHMHNKQEHIKNIQDGFFRG